MRHSACAPQRRTEGAIQRHRRDPRIRDGRCRETLMRLQKQNAGCRSWESSSGIAVDVQQRLNCALPSFSLSPDLLSHFGVFTAYPQMIN